MKSFIWFFLKPVLHFSCQEEAEEKRRRKTSNYKFPTPSLSNVVALLIKNWIAMKRSPVVLFDFNFHNKIFDDEYHAFTAGAPHFCFLPARHLHDPLLHLCRHQPIGFTHRRSQHGQFLQIQRACINIVVVANCQNPTP